MKQPSRASKRGLNHIPSDFAPELLAALGKNVSFFRKRRGWSQETLGFEAGIHRTYVCDIEGGSRNPGIVNVARIAFALEIPISKLLTNINGFARKKTR